MLRVIAKEYSPAKRTWQVESASVRLLSTAAARRPYVPWRTMLAACGPPVLAAMVPAHSAPRAHVGSEALPAQPVVRPELPVIVAQAQHPPVHAVPLSTAVVVAADVAVARMVAASAAVPYWLGLP
jgi:hypothetical protein